MDDKLISREAVRQIYREEVCRVKDVHDLEPFINRIESLPTVEQEPKWIPASERLPEASGYYLVTGLKGTVTVRYWRKAEAQQGGSYWRGSVNTVAWMPLPEPYKAESEIADAVVKKMQEPILDKVIEDIKTEIEECWQMYEDRFDVGDCLDIIDKHISGKESE